MSLRARLREAENKLRARGVLQGPKAPGVIMQFVGTLHDSEGRLLGENLDFRRAQVGSRVFERGDGEALEAFKARVIGELPATQEIGSPMVSFLSDDV